MLTENDWFTLKTSSSGCIRIWCVTLYYDFQVKIKWK